MTILFLQSLWAEKKRLAKKIEQNGYVKPQSWLESN